MVVAVIGLPLLVITTVVILSRKEKNTASEQKTNTAEQMRRLAQRFDLKFLGGEQANFPPWAKFIIEKFLLPKDTSIKDITNCIRLEGEYQGHDLRIYERLEHREHGGSRMWAGVCISGPNEKGLRFKFAPRGVIGKVTEMLGAQDIKTGDTRFDGLLTVKSNDPEFIKLALLPRINRFFGIWETQDAKGTVELDGRNLLYEELCRVDNEQTHKIFEAVVELLCELRGVIMSYNR